MRIQRWIIVVAIMVGVVVTGSVSASQAETLRVVGFNVESGDTAYSTEFCHRIHGKVATEST